jgi:cytochrome b561
MSIRLPTEHASPARWRYGQPAIVLHWLLALLIVFLVGLGWWMMTIERTPQGPWYFDLHRSIGMVVAALVALRLLWRAGHRPAPLPPGLPGWQVKLSALTQGLLYACMVVLPVTGFAGSLYSRAGIRFFGLQLPQLAPNRQVSHLLFDVHSVTVWVLVGLVALHVAGGLKHLLVDRDAVFQRMWFRG